MTSQENHMEPTSHSMTTAQQFPHAGQKLVNFHLDINLLIGKFYLVVYIGKDRRTDKRKYISRGVERIGNVVIALILLIGFSTLLTVTVFLALYFIKSYVGINLFKNAHLIDFVQCAVR
jgi:hypothetical protein